MEQKVLEIVNNELLAVGIRYEYGEFEGNDIALPYMVGAYSEDDFVFENNSTEGGFVLAVFGASEFELVTLTQKVKDVFTDFRYPFDGGMVYIEYTRKLPLQSGTKGITKNEIHLDVRYWKGL